MDIITNLPKEISDNSDNGFLLLSEDCFFSNKDFYSLGWAEDNNSLIAECHSLYNYGDLGTEEDYGYFIFDILNQRRKIRPSIDFQKVQSSKYCDLFEFSLDGLVLNIFHIPSKLTFYQVRAEEYYTVKEISVNPSKPYIAISGFQMIAIFEFDEGKLLDILSVYKNKEKISEETLNQPSDFNSDFNYYRSLLISYLSGDLIETALQTMLNSMDRSNEIIQQTARINNLNERRRLGICTSSDYLIERNQIRIALIFYVNSLEKA